MGSRFVPVILANADQEIGELLADASHDAPGKVFQRLCRAYRVRGCAAFFISCRAAQLHADLQRSGAAHAAFLEHAPEAEKATGRAAPFFDALACTDLATAERIAWRSSRALKPDLELPEDFHYVDLLMERFFRGGRKGGESEAILARFEEAVEGGASTRLDICRALLATDAAAFEEALAALVQEHRDHYATGLSKGRIPEEVWAIDGCLFVEGLALLRVAELAGLRVSTDYPLLPSLALPVPRIDFGPDTWRSP
ncbi:Imm49 family immunity protein [Archangium lansingense]|uniref:Imm49 family immunity protein n=1 Tax=Archangium lansingense TaxID=2995310 RepID=A0ABT3ZXH1_9BACT|nr:Imm49 family immunity protein [Archangium lansinium]MCY1074095.1 Imm49 family immunity protein [Archangium lansinium]